MIASMGVRFQPFIDHYLIKVTQLGPFLGVKLLGNAFYEEKFLL
jgi:hypothetical protein